MDKLPSLRKRPESEGDYSPVPVVRAFPELDLEKIKKDLNLVKEAQVRGKKNLPGPSSETFDEIENKIVSLVESEQRLQNQIFNEQLNTYNQRLTSLDLANEAANISAAAQCASTEFVVKVDDGKAKLFTLWRNVCMIENQWNDFRTQNKLNYPADYPLSRLWNFTVILVILSVESILNGNFLARGLETGLIGGIIEAFVIAAANVAFGFFLGDSVMRYLYHRNIFLRAIALIEMPISACISIGFNLLVGHYRDALGGADPMHASTTALNTFMAHPFDLAAMESWILFAMGLFFCAVAAVDGFKMDDPYPGYGKINRKHEEITQDYTNEKANIINDLSVTRDQALEYIREARQGLAAKKTELTSILDYREKLKHYFDMHLDYLNRAANELLSTYQNANMSVRTAPPPAYFNRKYTLPKLPGAMSLPAAFNQAGQVGLDSSIDKTDIALTNSINQVNIRFEEAIGAFHKIGEFTAQQTASVNHALPATTTR